MGSSGLAESDHLYSLRPHSLVKEEPCGNILRNIACPYPRSGHRSVVYNGSLYVIGGYTSRHPDSEENSPHIFQELWKFNYASKTWIPLAVQGEIPQHLASHAAVLLNNYLMVYGGTYFPFGINCSNKVYQCNLDTLDCVYLETTGEKPDSLYGQAIAVHGNKLYVVGGTSGFDFYLAVSCLDLRSRKWTRLDNTEKQICLPEPRYRHEIVVFKDNLYVFGGGNVEKAFDLINIPVFNLKNNLWSFCETKTNDSSQPDPRKFHGCVHVDNDVYVVGGSNTNSNGENALADVWKLHLDNLIWTKLDVSLPVPLFFHSVSVSEDGQMFVFGGVQGNSQGDRNNDLYSVWLKIPSLFQICWQAILHYIPRICTKDRQELREAGIPDWLLHEIEFETSGS